MAEIQRPMMTSSEGVSPRRRRMSRQTRLELVWMVFLIILFLEEIWCDEQNHHHRWIQEQVQLGPAQLER